MESTVTGNRIYCSGHSAAVAAAVAAAATVVSTPPSLPRLQHNHEDSCKKIDAKTCETENHQKFLGVEK